MDLGVEGLEGLGVHGSGFGVSRFRALNPRR